jgi:hypothetical protein
MDLAYHFRALDKTGATLRQSTAAYPTKESAQEYADIATRQTGLVHVVCESIDYKDPRNDPKNPLKSGYVVCDPVAPAVA